MGIISVRVANDVPIQSEYLPLISLYFLFNLTYTFISFFWFSVAEVLRRTGFNEGKNTQLFCKLKKLKILIKIHPKGENLNDETFYINIETLNKVIFGIMVLTMSITYLAIWIKIGY